MYFGGILESTCASIHASVCIQNTSFYQSADGGIKSHLVTALVNFKTALFPCQN